MRTTSDFHAADRGQGGADEGLEKYDRRHGWRGAWGHVEALDADCGKAGAEEGPAVGAPRLASGHRHLGLGRRPARHGRRRGAIAGEDMAWANATKGLKVGDLVFVEKPDGAATYRLRRSRSSTAPWSRMEPLCGPRRCPGRRTTAFALRTSTARPGGDVPAWLGLQAVRLRRCPGERLHAGQCGGRQRHHPGRGELAGLEPRELSQKFYGALPLR